MITKEQFIKNVRIKNPKADNIEFNGDFTGTDDPIDCTCKIDGYSWKPIAYSMYKNGCPVCANKVIIKGINDLWTTHPNIAKLLTNPKEGYSLTAGTAKKKYFTCPNCGEHVLQTINDVVRRNYVSCKSCNDSISTPNRIMYHLLSQLNVDFQVEKTFDWSLNSNNNKIKYDFLLIAKTLL